MIVSIQYRLAALGFLSSTEIKKEGTANAGLLDQRSALEWVKRNIAAFGGDPTQVTIIGGSAGGGSVMNQLIMYGGVENPPFRAGIAEYPWWQPFHDDKTLETQYKDFLASSGCSDLECLRAAPIDKLVDATNATFFSGYQAKLYGFGDFYLGPSVDGEIIRDLPSNEWKQDHFSKVPLLVDRDQYEGVIFTNPTLATTDELTADLQAVFPLAQPSFFSRLYDYYPESAYNSTFFRREAIFGDFIINCPTYYMATAASDLEIPTWKLVFNAGSQLHGATSPFLFAPESANNQTLSLILQDYFLSFVVDLDPNTVSYSGAAKPFWPQYQASAEFPVLSINYTEVGAVSDKYYDATSKCDFFHAESYVVRN